ncbi:hypothetical protein D3C74_436540 [compost metagenome]
MAFDSSSVRAVMSYSSSSVTRCASDWSPPSKYFAHTSALVAPVGVSSGEEPLSVAVSVAHALRSAIAPTAASASICFLMDP